MLRLLNGLFGATYIQTFSNPGAGLPLTANLNDDFHHWLHSLRFTLACDANAADRFPTLEFYTGGDVLFFVATATTALTANLTKTYNFAPWGQTTQATAAAEVMAALPPYLHVPGSFYFKIVVTNIQVGDVLSTIQAHWDTFPESDVAPTLP